MIGLIANCKIFSNEIDNKLKNNNNIAMIIAHV